MLACPLHHHFRFMDLRGIHPDVVQQDIQIRLPGKIEGDPGGCRRGCESPTGISPPPSHPWLFHRFHGFHRFDSGGRQAPDFADYADEGEVARVSALLGTLGPWLFKRKWLDPPPVLSIGFLSQRVLPPHEPSESHPAHCHPIPVLCRNGGGGPRVATFPDPARATAPSGACPPIRLWTFDISATTSASS